MNSKLEATKVKVHAAFCDNIDTRTVLETLKELVGSANAYVEANRASPGGINRQLLRGTALYITRIFDVLGLVARGEEPVGFPAAGGSGGGSADLETQVLPYLTALADFRDSVRKSAIEAKAVPILQECDRLRDDVLPNLGVRKDTFRSTKVFICFWLFLVQFGTGTGTGTGTRYLPG
jgi:cysteinyl-tRNA synthetase